MDLANQKRELQQQGEQQEGTAQRVKELEIEMISAYQALARVAEDVQDLRKQGHACDVDELQSWVSALAQLRPALGPHTHALTLYPLSTWLPLHPPPSPSTSPSPPLRLQLPPSNSPHPNPLIRRRFSPHTFALRPHLRPACPHLFATPAYPPPPPHSPPTANSAVYVWLRDRRADYKPCFIPPTPPMCAGQREQGRSRGDLQGDHERL